MEHFDSIDKNLIMLESMVRTILCSPDDMAFETFRGTLWAMEDRLAEIKTAAEEIRRPLLHS